MSILKGDYNIAETIQFRVSRECFKVNTGGFIWKGSSEFEYKHCLYDIIKISVKDDSLILYCLNDKTEEKISKSFHNELNDLARGDINNRKVKTSLSNLVSQGLIKNVFEMAEIPGSYKYFSNGSENILLNESEIPSPPPKIT
ncbi:MAG TPA: hypothetical protein VLB50_03770 [Ignavibacteriaceae bacterium]|nr:hypothetical protein [Ignavibacteriaceae bacterium]